MIKKCRGCFPNSLLFAEIEAKSGNFDTILPEQLFMALCKLSELPEETVAKLVKGEEKERTHLNAEIKNLKEWFRKKGMETTIVRRRLRSIVGKGKGSPKELHRSPESVAIFKIARELVKSDGEKIVNTLHFVLLPQNPVRDANGGTLINIINLNKEVKSPLG